MAVRMILRPSALSPFDSPLTAPPFLFSFVEVSYGDLSALGSAARILLLEGGGRVATVAVTLAHMREDANDDGPAGLCSPQLARARHVLRGGGSPTFIFF